MNRDCDTCVLDSEGCDCHMGHLKLPKKVYNDGYMEYVRKVLSCFCYECSKPLVESDNKTLINIVRNTFYEKRMNAVKALTNNVKRCPHCGDAVPIIKKDSKDSGMIRLTKEYPIKTNKDDEDDDDDIKKKPQKESIFGDEAYSKLENISAESCKIIGLDPDKYRPQDWIIHNFPISAPSIRPSVKADYLAEGTSEDDLTKKTVDIIKQADRIRKLQNNPKDNENIEQHIDNHTLLLQYDIAVYRNNDSGTLPKTEQKAGGKAIKSISERIQGKEGRLRHDLEGKRTNFCARTVISSDPNLSIGEVGVPIKTAMILTIPVQVTSTNIQNLTKYVRNGRNAYPGANYVWPHKLFSGSKRLFVDLKYRKKDVKIHVGDIVERHLQNGDPVLFNRQPSLHRPSIMCHRAVIIPDRTLSTFRVNVNVTQPYGADFDGDEMNLYVAQAPQTRLENAYLATVDKQIITPCYSTPIISFKQDTPVGLYLMTAEKKTVDWHDVMNAAMYLYDFNPLVVKKENITTHQLFSHIVPDMINFSKMKDGEKTLEMINGELLKGTITGQILKNELITSIWDRYGPKKTRVFIDNAQRLAEKYLLHKGFSVGYHDTIPSKEIQDITKKEIHGKVLEISHLLTEIENNPKLLDYDTFEKNVMSLLSTIKPDVASTSMKMLNSSNNFFTMIDSGGKGSAANIGAIMAGKGQEIMKFKRLKKNVNGRCLPHFCFNDDTAQGRGFIINSYYEGMDPAEFWFYHEAGREGLINTAIKTAETGYQQRRLIKAMESIMLTYDGTVRTSNNVILQLLYGDNQLDQTMQKKVILKSMEMNNIDMAKVRKFTDAEMKKIGSTNDLKKFNDTFYKEIIGMRNAMRINQLRTHYKYGLIKTTFFQPANYKRIINDIRNTIDADNKPLSPFYVMEQIEFILDHKNTVLVYYHDALQNPIKHANELKFKTLFRYALYEYLSPKRCIIEYKLNKTKLDIIVNEIISSFVKAIVQPGEMVGIVSAQSLGEPLTQMTLSSFHKSGSGVAGLQGTPRLKELLGYVKSIATPVMFIYMKKEFRNDKILVNKIAASLKYTIVKDIIKKIDIVYDSEDMYSQTDNIDTEVPFSINMAKNINIKSMPWLFRIHLNRESMLEHDIEMLDIKTKFINFWNEIMVDCNATKAVAAKINNACILTNFLNSENPMVHVRVELNNIDGKTLYDIRNLLTDKFYIKGNEKITKIDDIVYETIIEFDEETGDVKNEKEFVIYTDGINYEKIREISYIDQTRTVCNDTRVIYNLYGIESARSVLLKEIKSVFGDSINHHHIAMVCDLMTHTGDIISIDRFGLNKLDIDLLSKATFEKTMEILTDAAVFNKKDHLRNVSSRIMFGKPFKGGTGLCEVMMDNEILENSEFGSIDGNKKSNMNLSKMSLIDDILMKKRSKDLFIPNID